MVEQNQTVPPPPQNPLPTDSSEQTNTSIPISKGLIAAVLGFIIGLLFGGAAFMQDGYLDDSFSNLFLLISLPLEYFAFRSLGFKYPIVYPIVLSVVADNLQRTPAINWLNNTVSSGAGSTTRLTTAIMVAAIFLVTAYLVESLHALSTIRDNTRKTVLCLMLAFVPLALFGLFISSGPKLQAHRKEELAAFSHPSLEGISLGHVDKQTYTVNYLKKDGTPLTYSAKDITYNTGQMMNYPVEETMFIDSYKHYEFQKACSVAQTIGGTQSAPYEIKSIGPEGFKYGYASFQENASNPPTPSAAYITQFYCFIVNGDRYIFERNTRLSDEQIKLYPAEDIIKSTIHSKQEQP